MSDPVRLRSGDKFRVRVLEAVERLHIEQAKPPSPVAVALRLDIPPKTLQYHVRILEADGRVKRLYGGRALEVVKA